MAWKHLSVDVIEEFAECGVGYEEFFGGGYRVESGYEERRAAHREYMRERRANPILREAELVRQRMRHGHSKALRCMECQRVLRKPGLLCVTCRTPEAYQRAYRQRADVKAKRAAYKKAWRAKRREAGLRRS